MNEGIHRLMYNRIRRDYPQIPEWENLNEAQKEKVREANIEYAAFIDEIGMSIQQGNLLTRRSKIPTKD